jgi:hypothetical protein
MYEKDLVVVSALRYKKITISSLFLLYTYSPWYKGLLGASYDEIFYDTDRRNWIESSYSEILRRKYSHLLEPIDPARKIYISRIKESDNFWKLVGSVESYKTNKVMADTDRFKNIVLHISNMVPEALIEYDMGMSRVFTVSDELLLEEYFYSLGYKVISPGDYSVEEQIGIFSSSTVIAGAGGSGMSNLLFCGPETRVTLITAGNLFGYGGHERSATANNKQVTFFPELVYFDHSKYFPHIKFTAKELIDLMELSRIGN